MDRLGIHSAIKLDQYAALTRTFVLQDLPDIILGCAFLFIAVIMLICSFFLKKDQLTSWVSLSVTYFNAWHYFYYIFPLSCTPTSRTMAIYFLICLMFRLPFFCRHSLIFLKKYLMTANIN